MEKFLLLQSARDLKRWAENQEDHQMVDCSLIMIERLELSIAKEKTLYRSRARR
ncbi:hypothetical protein [Pelosinus sp. sgz500959]|uniref:hypothetical protein n=1 Tax=Pelosinus sp. sgz500959 TaxID=3242472 RepID=UPI00366E44E2